MSKIHKFLPVVSVLALALSASGGGQSADGAGSACGKLAADEICVKIGSGEPKSGGIAHIGKDNENGAQLAINEINAKGKYARIAGFRITRTLNPYQPF